MRSTLVKAKYECPSKDLERANWDLPPLLLEEIRALFPHRNQRALVGDILAHAVSLFQQNKEKATGAFLSGNYHIALGSER